MKKTCKRVLSLLLTAAMMLSMAPAVLAADPAEFMIEPYVLGPASDGMTIAWEADQAVEATISLNGGEAVAVAADADAPEFQGEQMNFYWHRFTGLQADTEYTYTVELKNGESFTASFETLPADPDEARVIFITDTHTFAAGEELGTFIDEYDPDFIIHTGDILEGTGEYKNQFVNWLENKEFIHSIPMVYAPGNHDYGAYYTEYFGKPQAEAFTAEDETGANYSFDFAGIHFIMIDSNPWGLMQMNVENAGGTISDELAESIAATKEWIADDLAAADDADFIIMGAHHPYADKFTQKHIPALIEEYGVDLYLAGHDHTWKMNVSADPAVGAGTVYICGKTAASPNWAAITVADDLLKYDTYDTAALKADQSFVLSTEKQQLSFSDAVIEPAEVLCNESVNVTVTVTNEGDGLAAAVVPVEDNGKVRYIYSLATAAGGAGAVQLLQPGESKTLYGTLKMSAVGEHELVIDAYSETVNVTFREAEYDCSNLRIRQGSVEKYDFESDIVLAKADVTNLGSEDGMAEVAFMIDGEVIETALYEIGAGETITAEFTYQFEKAGKYTVAIGNAEDETKIVSKSVTIEGGIQGMPMIPDQSGNENHGYIHGAPELSTDDEGNTAVVLNKGINVAAYMTAAKDYIEIPDDDEMYVEDGMTGMVKAKWLNDGKFVMFDHYPLMVKGPSISNGINYLFRMGIRVEPSNATEISGINDGKNGYITYGVSFDIENGEYFWNDDEDHSPTTNEWVTYTSSFDREVGGRSYMNDELTGSVKAPNHSADFINWEGYPIWIGMTHMAQLLTDRGRGGYNVGLSAEVSEVRFYTERVEADEVAEISADHELAGDSEDALAVWLDFNGIEQVGVHTTEVARVDGVESLTYTASIAGEAAIEAEVEIISMYGDVVDSKTIELEDGTHTVDLSDLEKGQFARIITTFTSDLNETDSKIPVLSEYVLQGEDDAKIWNTAASFYEGTFEDAVGHQSAEFYANFAKEVDNYSGSADDPYEAEDEEDEDDGDDKPFIGSVKDDEVEDVEDLIDEIGKVTLDDAEAIEAAREAYDELSASQKKKVGNYDELVAAEEKLAELLAELLPFTDVDPDDSFFEAVRFVYENGLMVGVGDGTEFAPEMELSRAMLVQILHMLEEQPAAIVSSFDDVLRDFWYTGAIDWAVANNVIAGYGNGTFGPNDSLTREQLAVILYQYAVSKGYEIDLGSALPTAAGTVSFWAAEAVQWAYNAGILSADNAGGLAAGAPASRADVAEAFLAFINYYA